MNAHEIKTLKEAVDILRSFLATTPADKPQAEKCAVCLGSGMADAHLPCLSCAKLKESESENQKCPRCGFVTSNVFACPTCKDPLAPFGGEESAIPGSKQGGPSQGHPVADSSLKTHPSPSSPDCAQPKEPEQCQSETDAPWGKQRCVKGAGHVGSHAAGLVEWGDAKPPPLIQQQGNFVRVGLFPGEPAKPPPVERKPLAPFDVIGPGLPKETGLSYQELREKLAGFAWVEKNRLAKLEAIAKAARGTKRCQLCAYTYDVADGVVAERHNFDCPVMALDEVGR